MLSFNNDYGFLKVVTMVINDRFRQIKYITIKGVRLLYFLFFLPRNGTGSRPFRLGKKF